MDGILIGEDVAIDVEGTFSVDAYVPPLDPGVKTVNAVLDNSRVLATTPFTVLPSPKPDLAVLPPGYWFEDDNRILVLSITVQNQGDAEASESSVDIRDQGTLPSWTDQVPALAPGETTTVEVRLSIPGQWSETTRTFLVTVTLNEEELNLDNNQQIIEVPVPSRGLPLWVWLIPPIIIIAGAGGYGLKRWMDTRKIKVHLCMDNAGTQQIESGAPIHSDSEIGLRPVWDPGKQSVETEDSSAIDERRERA